MSKEVGETGTLHIYTSRKYRVADMNPSVNVGDYKVIAYGLEYPDDDENIEDRYSETFVLETNLNGPFDPDEDFHQVLRDTFWINSCQHEYDCCGCRSRYVSDTRHIKDNIWYVEAHSARNY